MHHALSLSPEQTATTHTKAYSAAEIIVQIVLGTQIFSKCAAQRICYNVYFNATFIDVDAAQRRVEITLFEWLIHTH
jgi:hypothetical protein